MDERKNKMTDERYREILPVAYMTAAIVKGRQPRPVEVGLCARAIVDAEDENNLAYRVAMATKIHCTIVGVKRVPTKANSDKYEITYRTLGRDEDEMIPSPLLNGFPLGKVAEWLWGRKNDDGTDYWVGRRAVLYKHNVPVRRHPENGATDFENHTIVGSRGGVLMPRRRHSSVRERLIIYDCQVGKNQIICLRFANLRKVGRRHPTFLSPSASSGRHRLPGQKIGAAAPLFPVREGSRTATIAVLTDQGRSSSCKM